MSKIRQNERGSAMMITIVVVLILVGLSAAMLSENMFRSKTRMANQTSDEAQLICDAALERARRALLVYRNADKEAWGLIFTYMKQEEISAGGTGTDPLLDSLTQAYDVSGNPVMTAVLKWKLTDLERIKQEYLSTDLTAYSQNSTVNTSTPNDYEEVFAKIVPFGRGAYHIVMADNADAHGDGVDNDNDGDHYDIDNDDTAAEVALGNSDPLIDGDGYAFLVITAILPDGTMRQNVVKVGYAVNPYSPGNAIETNGSLKANGAFKVLGTMGSIMANENITGNGGGQAQVSVAVNAAGSTSGFSMNNTPPGGINSGVPPVNIPVLDIPYYKSADFALKDNVVILKADGTISAASGVAGSNFPFTSSVASDGTRTWSIQGNQTAPTPAVYYVEGNFKMTGQGNGSAYEMSLVAEGSVWLGGNSAFKPFQVNGQSSGVLALAGTDVFLAGTGAAGLEFQYEGVVIANEQAKAQGTYAMNGALVGVNVTDTPSSIVSNTSGIDLTLQGTPTITYNGQSTFIPPVSKSVTIEQIMRTK